MESIRARDTFSAVGMTGFDDQADQTNGYSAGVTLKIGFYKIERIHGSCNTEYIYKKLDTTLTIVPPSIISFHPRMVFLPNLGVNRRSRLCDVASYVSTQELDFLDLEQKSASVNWKHQKVPMPILSIYGWH